MRKDWIFTVAVIVTVAVGIGINTSIFTLIDSLLLRSLPYREPGRLIDLNRLPTANFAGSRPEFLDWKRGSTLLQDASLYTENGASVTGGFEPVHIQLAEVSASFFQVMGAQPVIGRAFLPEEDIPNSPAVAVISSRLWERQFNSDPAVLGRSLAINGSRCTVIGVLSPCFDYPPGADVWTPTIHSVLSQRKRSATAFFLIARMKNHATLKQVIAQQRSSFGKQHGFSKDRDIAINAIHVTQLPIAQSLHHELSSGHRIPVLLLAGAAGTVLLIASANIGNLALARVVTRNREFAIRRALGVGTRRLLQQIVTEQAFLGLLGGSAGVLIAYVTLPFLRHFLPSDWPSYATIEIDPVVLGFSLAVSFGVGILASAAPAIRVFHRNSPTEIMQGEHMGENIRQRRGRYGIVLVETSLAMLLLALAGLLVRGFIHLVGVDPGFRPNHVLTVSLTPASHAAPKRGAGFYGEIQQRLRMLPGARDVSAIDFLPARRQGVMALIEVKAAPTQGGETASPRIVMPGYFRTMEIPLQAGRDFDTSDTESSRAVAIVSDILAAKLWPKRGAVGQPLYGWGDKPRAVIGVVGSVHFFGPATAALPEIYLPYTQAAPAFFTFVLRSESNSESYGPAVRKIIHEIDPLQPIDSITTMNDYWARSMAGPRTLTAISSLFTIIGILLAIVGCYAVISYSVASRTKEFGIRLALGARPNEILAECVRQALGWVVPGIIVGVGLAFAARRLLQAEIYGIQGLQIGLVSVLACCLLIASTIAGILAARRATALDPMAALRND